ncbi:MAG TPA: hypothetical protein VMJ10_34265 [Kofleriaceae bacterium]|nr:hypothetical protein [Kofleriaceae bacterium]
MIALAVALTAACGHHGNGASGDGGIGGGDGDGHGDGGGGGSGSGGGGGSGDGGGSGSGDGGGSGSGSMACPGSTCALGLGTGLGAGNALATDSHRNVYVAGYLQGALVLGGHTFTPVGNADGFVASFTSDGTFRWAHVFGYAMQYTLPNGLAIDANDDVYVLGQGWIVDFGGGHMTSGGGFVASFTPDGDLRWATSDPSFDPLGIATAGGHVYTTGLFNTTATWGTTTLPDTDPAYHGYVARFDPATGAAEWAHDLGECGWARAIAATADGFAIAAQQSTMTLLATFTATGTAGPSRVFSEINGGADGLRVDAAGTFYMTGRKFEVDDRMPGAPMPSDNTTSSYIATFPASFAPPNQPGWSWSLVESPGEVGGGIYEAVRSAWDPAGHLVLASSYSHLLYGDASGDALGNNIPPYGSNLYMASFATDSTPLGAINPAPTGAWLLGNDFAIDSAGTRWITGFYQGAANLGDGPLPQTVGTEEGFYVLRYQP